MRLRKGAKIVDLVVLTHGVEEQLLGPSQYTSSGDTPEAKNQTEESKEEPAVLMLTERGRGKRVPLSSFKLQTRGGEGVKAIGLNESDTLVSAILVGIDPTKAEVMIASEQGMVTRTSIASVPFYSRTAKGVKLMNLKDGDFVKGMASTAVQEILSD